MFDKVGIPTVAVMENMCGMPLTALQRKVEGWIEEHAPAEGAAAELRALLAEPQPIFGESHVGRLKEMWGIDSSFSLPLLPSVASSADGGVPLVVADPGCEAAAIYAELAQAVDREVSSLESLKLPQVMYSAAEGMVLVLMPGGEVQKITPRELRAACRSPSNDLSSLPEDLRPVDSVPMGNYAISVVWSDGHQSLLPYRSFVKGYAGGAAAAA